jgi:VWFA-related protein
VLENGTPQQILSLRSTERLPIALAVLIQEDVVSSINNEIAPLGEYIRNLPEGSRVFVGYMGAGSLRVRQRWTSNTERAASSLRIPFGTANAAPFNPYVQIREGLRRFESIPAGRRAMLVITDGLDISRGVSSSSPSQSIDLDRAIREAQRRSVAVYSFYTPTLGGTANAGGSLVSNAQGSLARLTDDTGGHAFFQGTGAPVSFAPYLRELTQALSNQYALTYLSTNPAKGFNRIEVRTQLPEAKLEYPRGYAR